MKNSPSLTPQPIFSEQPKPMKQSPHQYAAAIPVSSFRIDKEVRPGHEVEFVTYNSRWIFEFKESVSLSTLTPSPIYVEVMDFVDMYVVSLVTVFTISRLPGGQVQVPENAAPHRLITKGQPVTFMNWPGALGGIASTEPVLALWHNRKHVF